MDTNVLNVKCVSVMMAMCEAEFMIKLSNTEGELKKRVALKNEVCTSSYYRKNQILLF